MTTHPYLAEFAAAAASLAILIAYHFYVRVKARANPAYTIQAVINRGRGAWVERVMRDREGILAVQTLRNSIMVATFFASTAVALIVGTITLSMQSDKLFTASHAVAGDLWLVKVLLILVDMLCAFVFFSQTIRLLNHVGIMISVPPDASPPAMVAAILIQAGRYHTRGMRCYYYAGPLLFWLFGPGFLIAASCALVFALYWLDKSPGESSD
jgi:uncharacterized membrane protein